MRQDGFEKLQKILKLADHASAGPGEREAAILKATEMAERMGIELAVVRAQNAQSEVEDAPEEIVKEGLNTKMKEKHGWHIFTMRIVEAMTDVKWTYTQNKYANEMHITMVGEKSDVIFAQYLFGYFDTAIDQQWNIARKANKLDYSSKKAFWCGAANIVKSKIYVAREQARSVAVKEVAADLGVEVATKVDSTRSLMVVEKKERIEVANKAFYEGVKIRHASPTRGFSGVRHSALSAGRAAGHSISLPGRPLGNGDASKLN